MNPSTPVTRADAVAWAVRLGLPAVVQGLAQGQALDGELRIFFGTADEYFACSRQEQDRWGRGDFVALWDDGNFDRLYGVHVPSGRFMSVPVEAGDEPVTPQGWQQVLIEPFIGMWESELVDHRFGEIADAFGFRFALQIEEAYSDGRLSGPGAREAWLQQLMRQAA